jgi:putative serine protease PepD
MSNEQHNADGSPAVGGEPGWWVDPTGEDPTPAARPTGEDAPQSAVPAPRSAWPRRLVAGGVLAAVAVGSGVTGAAVANQFAPTKTVTVTSAAPASTVESRTSTPTEPLAKVAAAVQPSVVSITVTGNGLSDEGSGIILRADGTILTNNHVIAAAAGGGAITVKFFNGKSAAATILGRDPTTDLAVIKASGVSGLTPATLGSSASVHVGDTVLAIGSPLGLEGSVTAGIVSALHRAVSLSSEQPQGPGNLFGQQQPTTPTAGVGDAIQTDAAINPGNSGGPLVDDQGRVIGINTAIASLGGAGSGQSGSIGVGFAIPIDEASSIANQLIAGKTPSHALLGVQVTDAQNGGALISAAVSGGAAAAAGLRSGDVITGVDSTAIHSADDLTAAIRSHQPGDRVTIHYTRGGQAHTAVVTLKGTSG